MSKKFWKHDNDSFVSGACQPCSFLASPCSLKTWTSSQGSASERTLVIILMVAMMIIWPPLVCCASQTTLVGLPEMWFTFVEFYLSVLRICHTLYFICTLSSSYCNLPYNPPREISKSKLTLRLKLQLHEKTLKLNIRKRVMSSADLQMLQGQRRKTNFVQ